MIALIPGIVLGALLYVVFASATWSHLTPWVDAHETGWDSDEELRKFWRYMGTFFWPIWLLQWPFRFAWWLGKPIPKLEDGK